MSEKIQRNRFGFIVVDICEPDNEAWHNNMRLKFGDDVPDDGILTIASGNEAATVFASRRDAQNAITRTRYWEKAFDQVGDYLSEKQLIQPVETIEVK